MRKTMIDLTDSYFFLHTTFADNQRATELGSQPAKD